MKIMTDFLAVRDGYTFITEGTYKKDRPIFNVWLRVNQQTFSVTPQSYDSREEAEWMREQLAAALVTMIKEHTPTTTKKGRKK